MAATEHRIAGNVKRDTAKAKAIAQKDRTATKPPTAASARRRKRMKGKKRRKRKKMNRMVLQSLRAAATNSKRVANTTLINIASA